MVMTTRAVHGEPHKTLEGRADHVVEVLVAIERIILLAEPDARAYAVEGSGGHAVVGWVIELVGGELLDDELVVRLVVIQGLDHVIAIAPCCRQIAIVLEARAVGVANDVQPVSSPTLAVMGRGQQPLDEVLVGSRRRILDEGVHLLRGWQQPDQVEVGAPDQGVAVGFERRRQSLLIQGLLDEGVDWILVPAAIRHLWESIPDRPLESPPLPVLLRDNFLLIVISIAAGRWSLAGVGALRGCGGLPLGTQPGALVDPILSDSDFSRAQRRHRRQPHRGLVPSRPAPLEAATPARCRPHPRPPFAPPAEPPP